MTRKLVADLLPGTQYNVRARSVGVDGVSQWSAMLNFVTEEYVIAPKAPINPTWVVDGSNFVGGFDPVTENTDNKPSSIARYEIELFANGKTFIDTIAPSSTRLSYTFTFELNRTAFVMPQPTVRFRARGVSTGREVFGEWSSPITVSNPAPGTPGAPSVGNVLTPAVDQISLAWTPPTDTDLIGYAVYVGSSANFTPALSNRIYSGTATRFTYTTTTYTEQFFKIYAVDVFDQQSVAPLTANGTPVSPFLQDNVAPPTPTALSAVLTANANGIGGLATLSWTMASPPSDLAGFYVRYRKSGDTTWYTTTFDGASRGGTIDLRQAYVAYEFQIKAFDWSNNESAWTTTVTGAAPTNAAPSNVSGLTPTAARDGIRYTWTPVSDTDLKEYEITFSTSSTFASGNTTFRTAGNVLTVGGLNPSTTYHARIRAVDLAGQTSAAWSSTVSATTLAASSTISVASLTSGTFSNIDMVLGPSANLVINGGVVKSNTYTGTTQTTNPSNAGFYLGNDGIRIDDGRINAKALVSSTLEAATITMGASGVIKGGSWELSSSGLTIPDGAIQASKLLIQNGQNLVPPVYSDFEVSNLVDQIETNGMFADVTNTGRFGSKSLGTIWGERTAEPFVVLGKASAPNIFTQQGTSYIISSYVWCAGSIATQVNMRILWSNGTVQHVADTSLAAGMSPTAAVRISGVVTPPAGATGFVIFYTSTTFTANAGFNVDGVMVEEKLSALSTPSAWKPGTSTTISGGQITTGELRSNAVAKITKLTPIAKIGTNGQPERDADGRVIALEYGGAVEIDDPTGRRAWTINPQGNAEFSNLNIRGNVVMGRPYDGELGNGDYYENFNLQLQVSASTNEVLSPNNEFLASDVGRPISGSGIPEGMTILGYNNSGSVYVNGQNTGSGVVPGTIRRIKRVVSRMSSANYIPGQEGWTVRSDGFAEFRNLAADSVTGKAIKTTSIGGTHFESAITVTTDLLIGNTIRLSGKENGGLVITQLGTDGKQQAIFPNTAGQPIKITADLVANTLDVVDRLSIRGVNNEISAASQVKVSAGTLAPKSAPSVYSYWDRKNFRTPSGTNYIATQMSRVPDTTNYFQNLVLSGNYGSCAVYLYSNGAYTLQGYYSVTTPNTISVQRQFGSVVKVVNGVWTYLTLVEDSNQLDANGYPKQYVLKYGWTGNAWTYSTRFQYEPNLGHAQYSGWTPWLGDSHGTDNVIIGQCGTDNQLRAYEYDGKATFASNPKGILAGSHAFVTGGSSPFKPGKHTRAIAKGNFDFGSSKVMINIDSSTSMYAFTSSGSNFEGSTSFILDGWPLSSNGNQDNSIFWDERDSTFKMVNPGYITHGSTNVVSNTYYIANTWVVANSVGPYFATYETAVGAAATFTVVPRAYIRVTTSPIPYSGGAYSPDATNIYISLSPGSGYRIAGTPRNGSTTWDYANIAGVYSGGNAWGGVQGFPNGTSGSIVASNNQWMLQGSGGGRIGDLIKWRDDGRMDMPSIKKTNTAQQGLTNGQLTQLSLPSMPYYYGNIIDNGAYITIAESGLYAISAGVLMAASNATGRRYMHIMVNGGAVSWVEVPPPGGSAVTGLNSYVEMELLAGWYVYTAAFQSSGAVINTRGDSMPTFMTVTRIR